MGRARRRSGSVANVPSPGAIRRVLGIRRAPRGLNRAGSGIPGAGKRGR